MLRDDAISFLHELATVYPQLLAFSTQISLHLHEGITKLIVRSQFDFEQKIALQKIIADKGYKVIECASDVWIIY